ncbi:MAG: hypothetical protein HYZ54_01260 [Ignavibacteriae bacterium]|nr:hypothetical protein [Ignavibacteriota bacterium]
MYGKFIKSSIILLSFIGLASCQTFITESNLRLSKGTTLQAFKTEDVDYDKVVSLPKLSAKNKNKYEVYMTTIRGAVFKEVYYYAFENDKLIYWGYPYQFSRSNNPLLEDIGIEAFEYSKKEYDLNE